MLQSLQRRRWQSSRHSCRWSGVGVGGAWSTSAKRTSSPYGTGRIFVPSGKSTSYPAHPRVSGALISSLHHLQRAMAQERITKCARRRSCYNRRMPLLLFLALAAATPETLHYRVSLFDVEV